MQSEASKKIDFLLRITGASNAQLARALSFDASYISRIRSGKRGMPPELPFIEPAAAFFARNVREGYQTEALAREMGVSGGWPASQERAARLIARWIAGTDAPKGEVSHGLPSAVTSQAACPSSLAPKPSRAAEAQLFFGNAGRREVALAFLERAAEKEGFCELLLQSDEETAWMYEDPAFTGAWAQRMTGLAKTGCTITVIHTVSRSGNEMWEGVREWLPLYLAGVIRPYYFPRLRDGVRLRSLFVARGSCALVSNSVAGMAGDALSILLDDHEAVEALELEFDAYLSLCRPLAEVSFPRTSDELKGLFDGPDDDEAVAAVVSGALVYASPGHSALVLAPGAQPVAYRVSEPRLVDALYGYVGQLSDGAMGPADALAFLERFFAS